MNKGVIPVKSENDKKEYRALTLENDLRVLLISEPDSPENESDDINEEDFKLESENVESDKESMNSEASDDEETKSSYNSEEKLAAAALCIGAGSFSDPFHSAGLAHYLEHMVFMGSEKYPRENMFDSFIDECGGSNNAHTDSEKTCFYFEITPKHLWKALDIFAQFFISPLLKIDSMDRELCAVNNEFQLALLEDSERKQALFSILAKEGHPMSKFMYGNEYSLKTLPEKENINIYEQLQAFRKKLYSAQFMTLVVQAKVRLDTLQEWVEEIFSAVPNNGEPRPTFEKFQDTYNTTEFYSMYQVIPVNKIHKLYLHWVFPSLLQKYKEKPFKYLNYLIEHEGEGGILSYLRKKVFALSMYSDCDEDDGLENNTSCSVFNICISLTEDGLDNLYEVVTVTLEYLEMLRLEGPCQRIANEVQQIMDNSFRWLEEELAYVNVRQLSSKMHSYPVEDYIAGSFKMTFDPELIKRCQNHLTYDNMNLILMSSKFSHDSVSYQKEKWFGTPYLKKEIDPSWKKSWNDLNPRAELHLPEENKFIADNFTLVQHPKPLTEYPVVVYKDYQSELWYKGDDKFKLPKATIYYALESSFAYENAKSAAMMDLFVLILKQNLERQVYAAKLADLDYSIKFDTISLAIKVSGFNQKLSILFLAIIDAIMDFDVEEKLFNGIKSKLKRKYENHSTVVEHLLKEAMASYVEQVYFSSSEKNKAIGSVSKDDLLIFLKMFKSKLYIKGLVQGNILENDSLELHKKLKNGFMCDDKEVDRVKLKCVKMANKPELFRLRNLNGDDPNGAVDNYYQFGPCSVDQVALIKILVSVMCEPSFDILRTKEQLSYFVGSYEVNLRGIYGISIEVAPNADKFSCMHVDERIENFLDVFLMQVANLDEDKFQNRVESEIKLLQQADLALANEVDRNWKEITSNNFVFDRRQRYIKSMKLIKLNDFKKWCKENLSLEERMRQSKVSVQVIGKGIQEATNKDTPEDATNIEWRQVPAPSCSKYNSEIVDVTKSKLSKEFYDEHKVI